MNNLHLCLLGPFRVTLAGKEIEAFGGDHTRALLAFLAIENSRPHPRQALASLFWPHESHPEALHKLEQALADLRTALGDDNCLPESVASHGKPPYLDVTRTSIQFNPQSDHYLDVHSFESLLKAALAHYKAHSDSDRFNPRLLQRALAIYQGPLLAHFPFLDSPPFKEWLLLQRESLNGKAIEGLELLMDYYERRGDSKLACQAAQSLIELAPWEETAHRAVMRALTHEGQWTAAQAHYQACQRYLAEELSLHPAPETVALYERIQKGHNGNGTNSPGLTQTPHNLPTSKPPCLGRERELDDLAELIADPDYRLITLLGLSGSGKTRLVLEAAWEQLGLFADGVFFISLESVKDKPGLISAIAQAIDYKLPDQGSPENHLLNFLGDKRLLLVLDHYQRHMMNVELVAALLRYTSNTTILLTCRQRTNLPQEYPFAVTGLSYPRSQSLPTDDIQDYPALALLIEKATGIQGDLKLDPEQMAGAVRICQLVEGLPLGLELAAGAAWSGSLSQTAEALADQIEGASGDEGELHQGQRSLQAACQLAWNGLSQPEREALQALAVFRGGFTRQAAQSAAGVSEPTWRSLRHKALLQPQLGASLRFDMHACLQQFASQQLRRQAGGNEIVSENHARFFIDYLHEIDAHLTSRDQAEALTTLSQEIDNVLQAWEWSVANGMREYIRKGLEGIYHYSSLQPRLQEGVAWIDQAIERWCGWADDHELCARLLSRRGALLRQQGLLSAAYSSLEDSLRRIQRDDNPQEEIFSLFNLARIAYDEGDYVEAREIAQECLSKARQLSHTWGISACLHLSGQVEFHIGEVETAEISLLESLALAERYTLPEYVLRSLSTLGDIDCYHENYQAAARKFEECLALSEQIDDRYSIAIQLNNLGSVFHLEGNLSVAQNYYRQSLEYCLDIGDRFGQAIALSNLGEVAEQSHRYEQANAYYERSLDLGYEIQDDWTVMDCLINLGELSCRLSRCHQAEMYLLEAIRIASKTRTFPMLIKALVSIGQLYLQLGQMQRAMDCICYALRSPSGDQRTLDKAQILLDKVGVTPQDCHSHTLEEVLNRLMGGFLPKGHTFLQQIT